MPRSRNESATCFGMARQPQARAWKRCQRTRSLNVGRELSGCLWCQRLLLFRMAGVVYHGIAPDDEPRALNDVNN
jgi:hypothetical protein